MKKVQTVLGEIRAKDLGHCQCHEHIMLSKGVSYQFNKALCMDEIDKSERELFRYVEAGGKSIIDAQPIGCNRMGLELAMLSKVTGVNILASTGFHKLQFYTKDHWIREIMAEQLAEVFVDELTKGMYVDADYGIPQKTIRNKASIIKVAYDKEELSDRYLRLFDAACTACLCTLAPIMIHVENGADPLKLVQYFKEKEVPLERLIFCHLDRACDDIGVMKEVLKAGCYLEFDTIGRFKYHSDEHELSLILELLKAGYQKQLLCSLDTTSERLKSYNPSGVGLDYILEVFIQKMLNAGVKKEQISDIFIDNCIDVLSMRV